MKPNRKLAKRLRNLGMGSLVDSRTLRTALGLPIRTPSAADAGAVSLTRTVSQAGARAHAPLVSIIVPSFNVEEYLADAVGTVIAQTYAAIEIIIVDDGSTDYTGIIADRLAEEDDRIVVVHKANGGLGAARNTGLSQATGKYVTFIDSDDQIPPDAIQAMVSSLERSGSDFVAGSMERFDTARHWVPEWAKQVHAVDRFHITAAEFPEILWDVFACNKLFRRSSWDKFVGRFPEGVLYEDQEGTARLFVDGAHFDVLSKIVYRWRLREDGSSITQDKMSVTNLQQRLDVAHTVKEVIEKSPHDNLIDYWYGKLLGDDLYWYFREVPRVGDEFWNVLRDGVRQFIGSAPRSAVGKIQPDRRILTLLVAQGNREDFIRALMHFQEYGAHWVTRFGDSDRFYISVPELDDLLVTLDSDLLQIDLGSTTLHAGLTHLTEKGRGAIAISGYAYLDHCEPQSDRRVAVHLVRSYDGAVDGEVELKEIELETELGSSDAAEAAAKDPYSSYVRSGFTALVPSDLAADLASEVRKDPGAKWALRISLLEGNSTHQTSQCSISGQTEVGVMLAGSLASGGSRFRFSRENGCFLVSADSPEYYATGVEPFDRALEIEIVGRPSKSSRRRLRVFDGQQVLVEATMHVAGDGRWRTRIAFPDLAPIMKANFQSYRFGVLDESGAISVVATDPRLDRKSLRGNYAVAASPAGGLRLERYAQFATVSSAKLNEDGRALVLAGRYCFDRTQVRHGLPSFGLKGSAETYFPTRLRLNDDDQWFEAEFSLTKLDADRREVFIEMGTYSLELLLPSGHRLPAQGNPTCDEPLRSQLPLELSSGTTRLEVRRRGAGGALSILLAAPYTPDERGLRAQRNLRSHAKLLTGRAAREGVLFESFGGRGISDSPKAIDAALQQLRPDLPRYWTVRDLSVAVPAGAIPLLQYSREWHEALQSVQYLVNNNNFPFHFRKHPDQVYVQTWHGTPLKRIGNDVPAPNLSLPYRALMKREAEQYWDYLIAQTPWAGEVMKTAFNYQGPVLDQGYPRNDALSADTVPERRQKIREFLGLSSSQKVVLYAPTWRDNLKASNGAYLQPKYLEIERIHKAFGRDVIILQRGHVNTSAAHRRLAGPTVVDVTRYPDINDLYVAADVLVTDYSSVQFDFVDTGKPILYLAPDLGLYRDVVRGFYFDFEAAAPGPVLSKTEEVVEAIRELDVVQAEFAGRYQAFRERFAYLDDGQATERVVSAVFGS